MKIITLILSVFFFATSPPTQASSVKNIQLRNSVISSLLPEKNIVCIERDLTGFIWVCTQHGLYKYDGTSLVKFSPQNSFRHHLNSFDIRQIYIGVTGSIFAATHGGGISKYDPVSDNFLPLFSSEDPNYLHVNSVTQDLNGDLWFTLTRGGVGSYKLATGDFQAWLRADEVNSAVTLPSDIIALPSGEIWFGAKKGLYQIQPDIEKFELYSPPQGRIFDSNASTVRAILRKSEEVMIVGTKSGHVIQFDLPAKTFSKAQQLNEINFNSINDLAYYRGKLWAATDLGLISLDEKFGISKRYSEHNSLLSNNDLNVLTADGNNLWVGTYFGINLILASSFDSFNTLNSGVDNEIMSFTEDFENRIWVGTYRGAYFKSEGSEVHHPINSLFPELRISDNRVMTSAAVEKKLWLGLRGDGLRIIDLEDGTNIRPTMSIDNRIAITKIMHTSNGESWVGTHKSGLYRFRGESVFVHYGLEKSSNYFDLEDVVTALLEAKDGMIYVGTENGLLKLDPQTHVFSQVRIMGEPENINPLVLSIAQDTNESIWVGTLNQGIFFGEKAAGKNTWDFSSIIPNATAYAIVIDGLENPWVSTTQGLLKLNTKGEILKQYSVDHGLQGDEFNYGASYIDSKGRIYFGGSSGYNRFDPVQVSASSAQPPVILTMLNIAGEIPSLPSSLQSLKKFQLSHNDYFFTITFSALDFLDPSKNQYSYKLEGFDTEWIDNGTRNSATYTNLPAGEYNFRVRGANSVGVWNLDGASIEVQVLPAPWLSWWAKLCYALATLVAIRYAKKIYDDRLIAKNVAVHAEQMRHAADRANDDLQEQLEIQDALVRSVYKHNTSTLDVVKSLHSVRAEYLNDPVAINASKNDENRLIALSYLESCVLYQDEVLYANLKKFTDMAIGLVLKSSDLPIEAITTINDVSNKMVPDEIATPLALVIFELLDNCVSHAFQVRGPANYIQISLQSNFNTSSQSHEISLVVSDDGIGLPSEIPDEELESTGLAFVRSVIEQFQGELTISDRNPGTRVDILLPNSPELKAPYGNPS